MNKADKCRGVVVFVAFFVLCMSVLFAGCGNKDYIDTVLTYDRVIIQLPNGEVVDTKIKSWRDYDDGEQLQITAEDGTVYLTNSFRCVLISTNEK